MFKHISLSSLKDYFVPLNERRERGIYFYRINSFSDEIQQFLMQYYEAARRIGVVIEGRIPNPTEQNLAYYEEIMGRNFQLDLVFLKNSLKKWLPRMNDYQLENVSAAIYDTLDEMRRQGKNDNILKNTYIKFMCWLYYKFERIVNQLGENKLPKILYEGEVSNHELKLLIVLAKAGCDILLLQYKGDGKYLTLDTKSVYSYEWTTAGTKPFPSDFSIASLRKKQEEKAKLERLCGTKPQMTACTNVWMEGKGLADLKTAVTERGNDRTFFYNGYCRIWGVEDKLTYLNELYQFYLEIKNSKRACLIFNSEVPRPTPEEIAAIRRGNYASVEQMISFLSQNIRGSVSAELQALQIKAFMEVLLEESVKLDGNIPRLTNRAVYLLCWLKRYQTELFSGWKMPQVSVVIDMGGCRDENEALFFKFLSRLPVDVLILIPDLNKKDCLQDSTLYEVHYSESLPVVKFPTESSNLQMGTAAYHAERELDTIMYQDSGMYRNQQYEKATALTLKVMYEEIEILWNQELKYRPNFSVVGGVVNMPVIFSKVSGVKDGQVNAYWGGIQKLVQEDTVVVRESSYSSTVQDSPMKPYATEFWKNGRLQRNKIKAHKLYAYGFLREEIQDYIFDKLQLLIDQRRIKGTFENGMEYTIIAVILNLKGEILRLIQKFDFTKKNPKLIYISTTEKMISLEDSILIAFLNLIGFDIVMFVPTGYQTVERYFSNLTLEEHQIGEYMYDLRAPNFAGNPSYKKKSFVEKLWGRRN
ncbi:MAG: YceG family protein [Lachnospiraceae bacterium]